MPVILQESIEKPSVIIPAVISYLVNDQGNRRDVLHLFCIFFMRLSSEEPRWCVSRSPQTTYTMGLKISIGAPITSMNHRSYIGFNNFSIFPHRGFVR